MSMDEKTSGKLPPAMSRLATDSRSGALAQNRSAQGLPSVTKRLLGSAKSAETPQNEQFSARASAAASVFSVLL